MSRRIRTVLYGDQEIEAAELDLLHTPAMQRLYDLHQLGLTDRVFIDASHSRLQHVVGVLQQVQNIIDAIAANVERRKNRRFRYRGADGSVSQKTPAQMANYVRGRRRAARLMGLLHDVTHAPFGHTLEDEIEFQDKKHDDPDRQADAFYRLLCQYIGWLAIDEGIPLDSRASSLRPTLVTSTSEAAARFAGFLDAPAIVDPPSNDEAISYVASLASPLLERTDAARRMSRAPSSDELARFFRDVRFAMRALLWLDALHKGKFVAQLASQSAPDPKAEKPEGAILPDGAYPFERLIDRILEGAGEPAVSEHERFWLQRDAFLLDIIGNTICADLLDYAKRDSHFAGLKLDYDVDRIVENFTLVSRHRDRDGDKDKKLDPGAYEPMLRTAISIFSHKLRVDAPGELMNLLQVRFYVYQRVLFHPTKCTAGAMLGRALELMGWKKLPAHYQFLGDAVFLSEVREVARLARDLILASTDLRPRGRAPVDVGTATQDALKAIGEMPPTSTGVALRKLLEIRSDESVEQALPELSAAIRLLDRLGARRYHRPVFRLLPNVSIPNLDLDHSSVANFFRNPVNRARAEKEIEQRSSLPHGTVTIHCPSGDGPKKIAEILLLNEKRDGEHALPLREIGLLENKIFQKHEGAVTALEEMYASMWRLVVSVAPPFHARHAVLTKRISRVLYAALCREAYTSVYGNKTEEELDGQMENASVTRVYGVPNDEYMRLELEASEAVDDDAFRRVRISYRDGREEGRTESFVTVADEAVPRLATASVPIRGFLESGRPAANEMSELELREAVRRAIPLSEVVDSVEGPLGEKDAADERADQISELDLLSELVAEKAGKPTGRSSRKPPRGS